MSKRQVTTIDAQSTVTLLLAFGCQVDLTTVPDDLLGLASRRAFDLDQWQPIRPNGEDWRLYYKGWSEGDGLVAIWIRTRRGGAMPKVALPEDYIQAMLGQREAEMTLIKRRLAAEPSPFKHLIGRMPFIIGGRDNPYLKRWWVIPRNRFVNIYLHCFLRSDDDRALHDHPWWNASILLRGAYREWLPRGEFRDRHAPAVVFRGATAAHRIELFPGAKTVWTLFLTGPKVREWGFLCPAGWRHWQVFTSTLDKGAVGRGCE